MNSKRLNMDMFSVLIGASFYYKQGQDQKQNETYSYLWFYQSMSEIRLHVIFVQYFSIVEREMDA